MRVIQIQIQIQILIQIQIQILILLLLQGLIAELYTRARARETLRKNAPQKGSAPTLHNLQGKGGASFMGLYVQVLAPRFFCFFDGAASP